MSDINLDRRKHKRYPLNAKLEMTSLSNDAGTKISVDLLDISKSGVGFFCDQELVNGSIYKAEIKLWTGDILDAFINIIRVERREDGNVYGGIFIAMPEIDSSRIEVYQTYKEYKEIPKEEQEPEEMGEDDLMALLNKALDGGGLL